MRTNLHASIESIELIKYGQPFVPSPAYTFKVKYIKYEYLVRKRITIIIKIQRSCERWATTPSYEWMSSQIIVTIIIITNDRSERKLLSLRQTRPDTASFNARTLSPAVPYATYLASEWIVITQNARHHKWNGVITAVAFATAKLSVISRNWNRTRFNREFMVAPNIHNHMLVECVQRWAITGT